MTTTSLSRSVRGICSGGLAVVVLLIGSSACTINPVSGWPEFTLVTTGQEKQIGAEEAKKVEEEMGLLDDQAMTGYLDQLGQRLAKESPRQNIDYHFHAVDMIEPNAFALPGGYIYVSRGLLALVNSEDELAGVVGHEIGHVAARHSVQKISRQGPFALITNFVSGITGFFVPFVGNVLGGIGNFAQSLVFSPYSRSQESEADKVGQEMAAKAGWNPEGLATFLNTLGREESLLNDGPRRPSFFDSHPATPDRVEKTTKWAKEFKQAPRDPITPTHEAFLKRFDGLIVGQRAANGVIQGREFRHPDLNFFVEFPDQWQVENTPVQLASAPKEGNMGILVRAVGEGTDPMEGARALEKAGKSPVVDKTRPTTVNGLRAAKAKLGDSKVTADITWIAHGGLIYQLVGITETKNYDAIHPVFQAVAESFRPLRPDERAGIREKRLRLVEAHAGERLDALVDRSKSRWTTKQVAVANNLKETEPLRAGQLIKVTMEEPYAGKQK